MSRTVPLPSNLFAGVPDGTPGEVVTVLASSPHVRVERIVSRGHASPDGFWYDQDRAEWVAVLTGAARLRFEGDDHPVEMRPGDWVNIPARRRHRVEWTAPDEPTVWLAVFYDEAGENLFPPPADGR